MLEDAARVAAALSPLRRRILAGLDEPCSAAGLAARLGLPRQKVNYHVRALERAGLLEAAGTRRRRGCVERLMRPTAHSFVISPALLGSLAAAPEEVRDRFSSTYLLAAAGRMVHEVARLREGARRAGKGFATLTIQADVAFATPADRAAFAEELGAALARLARKYHADVPGSRRFRFLVGGHPVPKPQPETGKESS